MLGITTLEEYFSWIRNLGNISKKYTVLPLDEDHFEINANTRAINIPASFKKNGVAVQGDDLAEVLYFKIDRYFDYMDLNNCDIYIQWETPKAADGTTIKSASPAYIRDIESEPGKLIFGWALSDAITANSGTLKFSVRFFQWEDPENVKAGGDKIIAYSFSTLTAQVLIQPSINFNPEKDEYTVDDVANRLLERLENSQVVGGYAAAVPDFVVDLVENPQTNKPGYDLNPDTNEFELLVQAFSSDTGAISYTWKRQALNEDNTTTDTLIDTIPSITAFIEGDKNNMNKSYVYYMYLGDDKYTALNRALTQEELNDDNFKVYLKQSKCIADRDGVYWAHAENRITNSSASRDSTKAAFLRPTYIDIKTQPKDKGILGEAGYTLKVEVNNTDGELTYQWYRDPNHALNFGKTAPIWNENEEAGLIPDATNSTLTVTDGGHYRVKVTNTRNLKSKYKFSSNSRITLPAATPIFIKEDINNTFFRVAALTDDNCPTIELDPSVDSDGYTVAWYLSKEGLASGPDFKITEDDYEIGVTKMSFNPKNFEEEIVAASPDNDIDGYYYAIVTNHLNGSKAVTEVPDDSRKFKINY